MHLSLLSRKVALLGILLLFAIVSSGNVGVSIIKPASISEKNFCGDKQHQKLGEKLQKCIRFRVVKNDTIGMADYPVRLSIISYPSGAVGFKLDDTLVYTDSQGFAKTNLRLGDKEGEYQVVANIRSFTFRNNQVYTFYGQSSKWLLLLLFGLLGGLGLFLFGMEMMGRGLQKSAGEKMRSILGKITKNRFIALGSGTVFTIMIQSSSAMAVMLVSFVNTRLMAFKDTIPILIGAAVGTTITAQLIAFKITDLAILFVGLGAAMYLFTSKANLKNIGESILGFGLLFYGLKVMSDAMFPLRSYEPFLDFLLSLENPFLGIAAGALFTALIHSSSACIGIIIIFAGQGLISLESGLYLLLGANLGTPATALIACIKTAREAQKVAYAQLTYKIIMVLTFVWCIPLLAHLLDYWSYGEAVNIPNEVVYNTRPRQIANAHTIINLTLALILFPAAPLFAKLIDLLFPRKEEPSTFKIKYLDNNMLQAPTLAINLAKQETLRLGRKVYESLDEIIVPFMNNDAGTLNDLSQKREENKAIRDEIKLYILRLNRNADEKLTTESFQIMHVLNELSHINDAITKILHRRAEKWIDRHYEFSSEGKSEIINYHKETLLILKNALEIFDTCNLEKARDLKQKKYLLAKEADQIELAHYERLLKENNADLINSKTHLEIVNVLNIISEHSFNIAKVFLQSHNQTDA